MSPSTTTVMVTGSKSGIGRNFLSKYALRDNHRVIAAIRDGPDSKIAKELEALPKGAGSEIIVAKYDAASESSVKEMVSYLQAKHGVNQLDTVVANAGILKQWGPVRTVKIEEIVEHFDIHVLGAIRLYQATISLLDKSSNPKFMIISSSLGSNTLMDNYAPMQMIAYNMAKSAVNHAAGRIHREEDKLVVVPVQPGWIATDMGSRAAVFAGMNPSDPPVDLNESVDGLMSLFDKATKEEHSGKFWDQKGEPVPW